jgi:hypothetical protein
VDKQKLNFWVMTLIGIPAFIWLLVELIRVFLEVNNRAGVSAVPLDGVIQHKIGELMVAAPLFVLLLLTNKLSKEKLFTLINQTQIVMIIGGLLNGLAYFSLRGRENFDWFFQIWCLMLLVVGLFAAPFARWFVSKAKENSKL